MPELSALHSYVGLGTYVLNEVQTKKPSSANSRRLPVFFQACAFNNEWQWIELYADGALLHKAASLLTGSTSSQRKSCTPLN